MINGLGERLQEQREIKGISRKQAAMSLGISTSVVSNYEKGERTPSLEVLIGFARLYHCTTDYLLGIYKPGNTRYLDASMLDSTQYSILQAFLYSLPKH